MHLFRLIFLLFMTWLLVVFLPAHTRGRITMSAAAGDECCEPAAPVIVEDECCAPPATSQTETDEPTKRERANCAVCFWAAGLLVHVPPVFEHAFAERAYEHARQYDAQVRRAALRLTHHGRDPPAMS